MSPRTAALGDIPDLGDVLAHFQPGPTSPPPTGPGTGNGGRPGPQVVDHIDVTPANLGLDDDLVAHALHALSQFGDLTPSEARRLLSKWARRDQLTDGQVAEVLAYYPPTLRAGA